MDLRQGFVDELHREHVREIAFLYDQREAALARETTTVRELENTEERLRAHLGGLLVEPSEDFALLLDFAASPEPGECYAAVRALCQLDRRDELAKVLAAAAWAEPKIAQAIARALGCELRLQWTPLLNAWLAASHGPQTAALARVAGWRNLGLGAVLEQALDESCDDPGPLLWALGRLRSKTASSKFFHYVQNGTAQVRQTAALGALQALAQPQLVPKLEQAAASESWAAIPLAVAAGSSAAQVLGRRLEAGNADALVVTALGLCGCLSAVRPLLAALTEPTLAAAAATALHLLSGAELWEEVDDIDESILHDEELAALRQGKLNAKQLQMTVVRLSRDRAAWKAWWRGDGRALVPSVRYRLGQPFDPGSSLAALLSPQFAPWLRDIMAQEIEIRYRVNVRFVADMMVNEQRGCIREAERYLADRTWQQGAWYLSGKVIG